LKTFLFLVTPATAGHNFERGPNKDHLSQIWFSLVMRFHRERFKCKGIQRTTDAGRRGGRTPDDDKSSHGVWEGELKSKCNKHKRSKRKSREREKSTITKNENNSPTLSLMIEPK
jgi:hypothetical protein